MKTIYIDLVEDDAGIITPVIIEKPEHPENCIQIKLPDSGKEKNWC